MCRSFYSVREDGANLVHGKGKERSFSMGPKLMEEIEGCVKFVPHMGQAAPDETAGIVYPLGFDSPIYRYMPIKRYLEMIETGVNALSHFSLWEDPYEAYLIRAAISDCARNGNAKGEKELYGKYKFVYGQSWTLNGGESDVLWRAFGNRGDVVRVRSTIRKLFNTFVGYPSDAEPVESLKLRIGDVEYCNQADLERDIECQKLAEDLDGEMGFFFRKRKEFEDEHELRCVALVKDEKGLDKRTDVNGSVLKFRIGNIDDFIEEVLLDPRVSPCVREQVVCRTLHRSSKIKVEQSDLFEWPDAGRKNVVLAPQLKGGGCTGFAMIGRRVVTRTNSRHGLENMLK